MNKVGKGSGISAILVMLVSIGSIGQTQTKLNQDACRRLQGADVELNRVYNQILNEYGRETMFIEKLKIAQRAWLAFRDAHLDSLYPAIDQQSTYGSVYPMCRCSAMAEITTQRVAELRKWIKGTQEGDVCSGSIRIKNR